MVFNTGSALLDAIVLAVVSREQEGTYGYKITQDVRRVIDISESTLYPVLRRLQKEPAVLQDHGAGAGAAFAVPGGVERVLAEDIPDI